MRFARRSAAALPPPPTDDGPQLHFAAELERWVVGRELADARAFERARRAAAENGQALGAVLTQLGVLSDRALAEATAAITGLTLVDQTAFPDEPVLPERLRGRFLRQVRAVPLSVAHDHLLLALADPQDTFTPHAVSLATRLPVRLALALPSDLEAALDRLYPKDGANLAAVDAILSAADDIADEDTERLKDLASEAPVIRLVNQLIFRAVETRASDVHIEPGLADLRVRYRYDGVLHEVDAPPARLRAAIISRIKIMARLDIAERRLPQDGRIKLVVRGQEIDLRVSTIPSLHGETVVLRILDRSAVELDFPRLGLDAELLVRLRRNLDLPNGIFLVTGPTGSGKTTTLYTALTGLNAPTRKIVTVEDPIEYQLAGINQIQVKPQIGLTFAHLLRSILRQDPDIIMIGEIRDLETAQIAVQAALTGHLVLSTLHTNSATATITRLRDMGVDNYLIAATLNGVLGQRLVRKLCTACRRPVRAPEALVAEFGLARFADPPIELAEPVGCAECRGTGFLGRMAVGELLITTERVKGLILSGGDETMIQSGAEGMTSMFDSGLRQLVRGTTTLAELMRNLRAEE